MDKYQRAMHQWAALRLDVPVEDINSVSFDYDIKLWTEYTLDIDSGIYIDAKGHGDIYVTDVELTTFVREVAQLIH